MTPSDTQTDPARNSSVEPPLGAAPTVRPSRADETFSLLTGVLQAFVDAWEEADEPVLAEFLPDGEDPDTRRLCLAELIKIDLEYRWGERNRPKRITEYVAELVDLRDGGCPLDVIYEEFHLRKNCGFAVDPSEYVEQFPEHEAELRRLLDADAPYESTCIGHVTGKGAIETITPGATMDDFELLAELGKGAFAKVFLARQVSMQRLVALKVSAIAGSEHQMLAQFDHESIVRVYDQRIDEDRELRLLYMQYVPGGTLKEVVEEVRRTPVGERDGRTLLRAVDRSLELRGESRDAESSLTREIAAMPWPEAVCWIGIRLAEALDYAHSRGVLHRDVKPANVLVSREGVPKLADFNIGYCSKQTGASPAAYFGGSLAYMSPEQLEACNPARDRLPDDLDGRSDMFTLAVVLWELLTGDRPFHDDDQTGNWPRRLAAMADRRLLAVPQSSIERVPDDCPPGLVRVLLRSMAPDRADRWQSGRDLARQLEACRDPELQSLLHPQENGWTSFVRRFPVLLFFLAVAIPNGLAGVFNFAYNQREIVGNLGPEKFRAFMQIQTCVNAVLYPLGFGFGLWLVYSVWAGAERLSAARGEGGSNRTRGDPSEAERTRELRRRCLALGHVAAIVGIVLWLLAGFVYPVAMHFAAGTMPIQAYVHFWASLVLCGLVAAAYPFFGVTAIALRGLYPRLAGADLPREDVHLLERVRTRTWAYLAVGVTVPFAAMMFLGLIESEFRLALVLLSGVSLVGFGFVYWLFRVVQRDTTALLRGLAEDR